MPYPNYHACRLVDPDSLKDDSFRTMQRKHEGKSYSVILGRRKEDDKAVDQAYRYPKDSWSVEEARSHCKAHNGISFEPAKESSSAETISKEGNMGDPKITVATLQEEHPDVYREVFDLGVTDGRKQSADNATSELQAKLEATEKETEDLRAEAVMLRAKNSTLEKQLAIQEAREEKAVAEEIMAETLKASNVPENLHAKVRQTTDYTKFRVEGEKFALAAEGEDEPASVVAFREAFGAEVADWEARVGVPASVGLTKGKTHEGGSGDFEGKVSDWDKL